MKVILTSLILLSGLSINACKTCYYYEQQCTQQDMQADNVCCCQHQTDKTPSPCNTSEEHCNNGTTYEDDSDYLSPNNGIGI